MKKILLFIFLVLCLSLPVRARAIDPGSATGTLTIDQDTIELKHAYAHLHDNAENWLDTAKEMRILLTDRQIPQESLAGLNAFFTLSEMLKQNKLRGVLLRFDPAKPNSIMATVLYPPRNPNESLVNKTLSSGKQSPIDKLAISSQRVTGTIKQHTDGNKEFGWPAEDYSADFSAPLFKEPPVTANLSGKKALQSPQVAALLAKYAAMAKGDMNKARQYCTPSSNLGLDTYLAQAGEEAMPMMRQMASEQEQSIRKGPLRLIVRGDKATLIIDSSDGKSQFGFVKEGSSWKND